MGLQNLGNTLISNNARQQPHAIWQNQHRCRFWCCNRYNVILLPAHTGILSACDSPQNLSDNFAKKRLVSFGFLICHQQYYSRKRLLTLLCVMRLSWRRREPPSPGPKFYGWAIISLNASELAVLTEPRQEKASLEQKPKTQWAEIFSVASSRREEKTETQKTSDPPERFYMAGVEGFEPPHVRIKTWCLTAWRHPNSILFLPSRNCWSSHDTTPCSAKSSNPTLQIYETADYYVRFASRTKQSLHNLLTPDLIRNSLRTSGS